MRWGGRGGEEERGGEHVTFILSCDFYFFGDEHTHT